MAIKHTAVSYYGFNYVEHAEKDFIEMKVRYGHSCDYRVRHGLLVSEYQQHCKDRT